MTCCVSINAKEGDCWIQLVNCMVVFDVTQMSYQSSDRVYRAQKVSKAIYSVYRACKVKQRKVSVNRAHSVIEEKMEKSVLTELTRSSQGTQCLPSSLGD